MWAVEESYNLWKLREDTIHKKWLGSYWEKTDQWLLGCGGGGQVGKVKQGIIKRHKETSGDYRYVHYLDCGESFHWYTHT